MYVLDTNTLIYFFKGMGNVNQRLLSVSPKDIGIPSVVVYELEYGIAKSTSPKKRQKQLEELISLVNVLPFNELEAKKSADIRAKLEKQGTPIGPYDTLIAGTALAVNGILVTNNTKEFERVKHLKLENWYK
ncbi:type II toxin-antitoxin system tRNA(fMet)-specific endonuclease VapC [Litoribacillus peritrichatus]|uniref:Ribonuclease VapC n=1 Tax=Litoribacillus peritrichatus TaxID=718191 RepID=A0ABP7M5B4_9GAMM